jgi:hypothetical protein
VFTIRFESSVTRRATFKFFVNIPNQLSLGRVL